MHKIRQNSVELVATLLWNGLEVQQFVLESGPIEPGRKVRL